MAVYIHEPRIIFGTAAEHAADDTIYTRGHLLITTDTGVIKIANGVSDFAALTLSITSV